MGNRFWIATGFFAIWATIVAVAGAQTLTLEFEAAQPLPNFHIDGQPARIHTQGLFVTEKHYFVTGRLETEPRRALFLRFDRKTPAKVEFIDITPTPKTKGEEHRLDHPGGFDHDGRDFWIPISASKPHSRTVVLRVPHLPDRPLADSSGVTAFECDDHIGAIAYNRTTKELCGANWDTKIVYRWKPDGTLIEKIPRSKLVRGDDEWALAVQDWKGLENGRLLAGGIDKSRRETNSPRAVIAVLDIGRRARIASVRLPRPDGSPHTLTREGLAIHGGRLFFLPGDLGTKAHIFRYRWRERDASR